MKQEEISSDLILFCNSSWQDSYRTVKQKIPFFTMLSYLWEETNSRKRPEETVPLCKIPFPTMKFFRYTPVQYKVKIFEDIQ